MKGFLLFIVSILIVYLFMPLAFAYNVLRMIIFNRKDIGGYYHSLAVSVDQFGNVAAKYLLNDLITKGNLYYPFWIFYRNRIFYFCIHSRNLQNHQRQTQKLTLRT